MARRAMDSAAARHAVGYLRVSTAEQCDSGLGLADQRERIAAYAAMKGLTLVDVFIDEAVSGGKPVGVRPGGAALLKRLRAGGVGAVVALKLDRLFRNAADALTTCAAWDRAGVALHVVDLGGNAVDTASAAGRFMLTVLAGVAEMERGLIRERTRAALRVKRARHERCGAVPFGWDLAADGVTLTPNVAELAVIADMQRLRGAGWSFRRIAGELTARGVLTKAGNPAWTHQAVRSVLARAAA